MFWVFCNSCFIKPSQSNKRHFYITSCSHIFCDRCIRPDDPVCKRCQTNCVIVQCNAEMPEEVKEVFSNVHDNPSNLIKAMEFQDFHRKRLIMYYKTVEQKYAHCKVIINDLQRNVVSIEQQCQNLQQRLQSKEDMIRELTRKLQWCKQRSNTLQTPLNTPHSSQESPQSSFEVFSAQGSFQMNENNLLNSAPRGSFISYRKGTTAFTPKSGVSNTSVSSSKFSTPRTVTKTTGDKKRLITGPVGFTPPANALALLSLMNRSRNHSK